MSKRLITFEQLRALVFAIEALNGCTGPGTGPALTPRFNTSNAPRPSEHHTPLHILGYPPLTTIPEVSRWNWN